MRKLVMAIMVFCAAGQAFALTPLGPPRAGLKTGQQSLGFVFASSEMDLEMSGYGLTETIPDIESTAYLAKSGYGLSDGCEIFCLVGFTDISAEDYDGDSQLAWGFGAKFTFAEKDQVTWGGLIQFLHISTEGSDYEDIPGFGMQLIEAEVKLFDIQIAFGPTYTKEAFSVYGGPFLHFVEGDLDGSALGETVTLDLEQKSEFGGFVGAQFELAKSASLFMEYQMTGDASAIAGGIVWRF